MKPLIISFIGGVTLCGLTIVAISKFFHTTGSTRGVTATSHSVPRTMLWHCGMHPQVIQDHPGDCPICHMALTPMNTYSAGETNNSTDVQIDPRIVQNMGVRTAEVTLGNLSKHIRATGSLTLPEPAIHEVSLKMPGWIEKLHVDQEGMHVSQGDLLFEVYSPELQVASQELISANKALHDLPANSALSVRNSAQILFDTSKTRLELWDISDEDINTILKSDELPRTIPFRSRYSGHVEEKMIVQGSAVQPGMKLLRIADHSQMWLDIDIFSEDVSAVALGQIVNATVAGMSGKQFTGTISFIYPHLDLMNRTMRVRATLDNPDFDLKPGMYASAEIITLSKTKTALCPREAVIDTGEKQLVFISKGDGRFSAQQVVAGNSGDDDKVQIISGLSPGDLVVTSGQFLMDVESRTIEATLKLQSATQQHSSLMKEMP